MQCQTCAFFHAAQSQCRRYAPQPQAENSRATAVWPTVAVDDWCGEYKAKDATKAA